jgi:hypothetical protein
MILKKRLAELLHILLAINFQYNTIISNFRNEWKQQRVLITPEIKERQKPHKARTSDELG